MICDNLHNFRVLLALMNITLHNVGKRFQRHTVFKGIDYSFKSPGAYALLGSNGSGKSTLLRILAGMQSPSSGSVAFTNERGGNIDAGKVFQSVSFCAPGQELVEEFTLREFLGFHFSFKRPLSGHSVDELIAIAGLQSAADRPIYDYSSGMKQRVKLLQAIFSDAPVLLLDEPCANLDETGVGQYREWMESYTAERMVIVASNDPREYYFCKEQLRVEDYR